MDNKSRIDFIDISAADFDETAHGLVGHPYQLLFTSRNSDSDLLFGVHTFLEILRVIGLRPVAFVVGLPGIYSISKLLYLVYARNRPRLARLFSRHRTDGNDG